MENCVGKNAVVTGGSGGIGLAICRELLKNKIKKLAFIDLHDNDNCEAKLKADFPESTVLFVKGSVATEAEIEKAFNTIKNAFGSIYIIVNSAGIVNEKKAQLAMDINLGGVVHCSRMGMSLMSKVSGGEGGYIINIASMTALSPLYATPVYCATKSAIITYTRCMANDYYYNKHGVKYMVVCPGKTITKIGDGFKDSFHDIELLPIYGKAVDSIFGTAPLQEPSVVADCVTLAIKSNHNGSVWMSSGCKNLELNVSNDEWKTL